MAFTTPATAVSLSIITAGWLNTYVRDNIAWMATDSPAARVYRSSNLAVGTGAWGSIGYDSERFDNASIHDNVTNNDRLTIPTGGSGKYIIGGGLSWQVSGAGGGRSVRIGVNGTSTLIAWVASFPSATVGSEATPTTVYAMSAADYLIFQAWQDSGGNLNAASVANYSPEFWCLWFRT